MQLDESEIALLNIAERKVRDCEIDIEKHLKIIECAQDIIKTLEDIHKYNSNLINLCQKKLLP